MIFLSLVVVLAIIYWLGNASFIQHDGWFRWLAGRLQKIPGLGAVPSLVLALALLIPLLLLLVVFALVYHNLGKAYLFFLYVPVLLYSLGRGNFMEEVKSYIELVNKGDTVAASLLVENLRGRQQHRDSENGGDSDSAVVGDWQTLHTQALKVFAYRGFERTFAVIFWFVIIGPFGALLYRLSALYREQTEEGSPAALASGKWLWLLELPAVRLMGLTWAFVGNFETSPLRRSLLDMESSSARVLNECLRGALGAATEQSRATLDTLDETQQAEYAEALEEEAQDIIEDLTGDLVTTHNEPGYSFALIKSSLPLYNRALLFWACAIAFATLFV